VVVIKDLTTSDENSVQVNMDDDIDSRKQNLDKGPVNLTWSYTFDPDLETGFYLPYPKEDKDCILPTVFAKDKSLPTIALVSFPGSGNSWFRIVVEALSGIFTGSGHQGGVLPSIGLLGDQYGQMWDGKTILFKTHHTEGNWYINNIQYGNTNYWRKRHVQLFKGIGVLIIRNPFDAIISFWNLQTTLCHQCTSQPDLMFTEKFQIFALTQIIRWYEVISDWLDYSNKLHVVLYEDMQKDIITEVQRALKTFGYHTIEQKRIDCFLKYSDRGEKVKRGGHFSVDPFPIDVKQHFRNYIDLANEKLVKKTGKKLPTHLYKFYNASLDEELYDLSQGFWL